MTTDVGVSWWHKARCVKYPKVFFAADEDRRTPDRQAVYEAKTLCQFCPVLIECAESLLVEARVGNRETFGIRAGMTARQQRLFIKRRL